MKIKIIKKNDDYSLEYEVGDIFDTTGMVVWRRAYCRDAPGYRYHWIKRSMLYWRMRSWRSPVQKESQWKKNMEVDNEADSTVSGGK